MNDHRTSLRLKIVVELLLFKVFHAGETLVSPRFAGTGPTVDSSQDFNHFLVVRKGTGGVCRFL